MPSIKPLSTFLLAFLAAIFCSTLVHECGHAVAGWMQGIEVVPTPLKEYILRDQIEWDQETLISLGGVTGTILLTVGTLIWYVLAKRPHGDAVFAGVLLSPFAYTFRFILAGRGHDGLEWQAAQSALGLDPSGHAVDVAFLALLLISGVVWIIRKRALGERLSPFTIAGLAILGIALMVTLQTVNNRIFDGFFPRTHVNGIPLTLEKEQESQSHPLP